MTETHPYWLKAYYGPGGRKGGKGRVGEREGDLCISLRFATPEQRTLDLNILKERDDVVIIMGEDKKY